MRWLSVCAAILAVNCAAVQHVAASDDEDMLAGVASHVRIGETQEALEEIAALPKRMQQRPDVLYLTGRLLYDADRHCDAADAMKSAVQRGVPTSVRTDVARWLARANTRCGRCTEPVVGELSRRANESRKLAAQDRLEAARCMLKLGHTNRAIEDLKRLTSSRYVDAVAANLLLAEAYEKVGDSQLAADAMLDAWVRVGRAPRSASAAALSEQFPATLAISLERRLDRIDALLSAREHQRALDELDDVPRPKTGPLRAKWLHLRGMALFGLRTKYRKAATVLTKAAMAGGGTAAEDEFYAARAFARAGKERVAIAKFRSFARKYRRHSLSREADYLAAWLLMREKRGKAGVRAMQRVLDRNRNKRSRWHRAAQWQLAFHAFERRQYKRAAKLFSRYAEASKNSMDRARGLYWLGRSLRRGDKAVNAYMAASRVEPYHWYGQLAAQALKRLGRNVPEPFDTNRWSMTPPPEVALPEAVGWYKAIGLDSDAERWIETNRRALGKGRSKAEAKARLVALYQAVDGYSEALDVARTSHVIARTAPSDEPWWWRATYPQPWRSTVDETGVPPELLYGVMRQESGFNPLAKSRAGASGVLQLMPKVAKRHAKALGLKWSDGLPHEPTSNIRMGGRELKERLTEFGGNMVLAVASYNAGAKRVRQWLKQTGPIAVDRFVEKIPFNETRNYVRRVMTHRERYRHLADPNVRWPDLPQKVRLR